MSRRGLTMLELLLSLVLLGAIATSLASWIGIAARLAAADSSGPRAAAEMVLSRMHDDLVVGDRADPTHRRGTVRVRVLDDGLLVRTRAVATGAVDHAYRLDAATGDLARTATDPRGRQAVRPLLDGVRAFTCTIDERDRLLDVAIELDAGETVRRRMKLP